MGNPLKSVTNENKENEMESIKITNGSVKLDRLFDMMSLKIDSIQGVSSHFLPDEIKDQDQEKKSKDTGVYIVPLSVQSDIFGRAGAWRAWSCIWLAHLIHDAIDSIPMMSGTLTPIWKQRKIVATKDSRNDIWKFICKAKKVKRIRFNLE